MQSILFVCLGNICRSPLAEGVFGHTAAEAGMRDLFHLDSAGTGAWHIGNAPDPRSIEVARRHSIDIATQRARQVQGSDFEAFDLILAMDESNLATLRGRAPASAHAKLRLFLDTPPTDVPDPYYGGPGGFDDVYEMLKKGSQTLLKELTGRSL
ncbi:MAG: low molecular weight phosphotyrosine protein phosphatase [Rhodobacteraceae bacterium]|nr:low molecular weight phosphotyrosine protein phosphatase [Paracoccaceae bacterium]